PAPAQPASGGPRVADSGSFFTRLFSSDGDKAGSAQAPTGSVSQEKKTAAARPSKPGQLATAKPAAPAAAGQSKPGPQPQYAAAKPLPPATDGAPKPANGDTGALSSQPGASGNFDNRWGTGR